MILNTFTYKAPDSLQEAVALLGEKGTEVFTGDQAYVGGIKAGAFGPSAVVSLRNVPGLNSVIRYGDQLVIGSLVSYADMLADSAVQTVAVLVDALRATKDPHVKNHSNVGGALLHRALSHGPILAAFLALDGTIHVTGAAGDRQIPLETYLSATAPIGEVVKSISLTISKNAIGSFHFIDYLKAGKVVCGAAAAIGTKDGLISSISLAVCGCVSVPQRLRNLENSLIGAKASKENLEAAFNTLPNQALVLSNALVSNPSYLLHLLKVLIKRAVLKANIQPSA